MSFLLVIFIIVAAFWLLRRLFPLLLLWLVSRQQKRWSQQFGGPSQQNRGQGRDRSSDPQRNEGEITLNNSRIERRVSDNVGEYVDYHEQSDKS